MQYLKLLLQPKCRHPKLPGNTSICEYHDNRRELTYMNRRKIRVRCIFGKFEHYASERHTRKHSIMPKNLLMIWHYTPLNNSM